MTLCISIDGGRCFSSAYGIAPMRPDDAILDDARVALAASGGGTVFVK